MNRVKHLGRVTESAAERRDLRQRLRESHNREAKLNKELARVTEDLQHCKAELGQAISDKIELLRWKREVESIRSGMLYRHNVNPRLTMMIRLEASSQQMDGAAERMAKAAPIIDVAVASQMRRITQTISEVCPGVQVEGRIEWSAANGDSQSGE